MTAVGGGEGEGGAHSFLFSGEGEREEFSGVSELFSIKRLRRVIFNEVDKDPANE